MVYGPILGSPPAPLLWWCPASKEGKHGREGHTLTKTFNNSDAVEQEGVAVGIGETLEGSQGGEQGEDGGDEDSWVTGVKV